MLKKLLKEGNLFWISFVSRILILIFGVLISGGNLFSYEGWHDAWVQWDGVHYLDIAENGYDSTWPEYAPDDLICNQGTGYCQRNFAFFPMYPLSVGLISRVTGIDVLLVGLGLSLLCFSVASLFVYKIARHFFDSKTARFTYLLLLGWPASYVFSGMMTESMFLMFLSVGVYSLIKKEYFFAGVMGLFLALTRNTGFLFAGISFLYLLKNKFQPGESSLKLKIGNINLNNTNKVKRIRSMFDSMILPVFGLALFMVICCKLVGDPIAFINIQEYWEKPVLGLNPFFALPFSFIDWRLEGGLVNHIYNLVWFGLWLVFFVYGLRKKLFPAWMNFIWLWLLVPLTAGSMLALSRYMVVVFPLYITIGYWISKRRKFILIGVLGLMILAQLILLRLYTTGWWITV